MDNMRGFTVAIYPETRKELEIIKNKNNFTWDELFNYLMKVEKSEKPKQEAQEERKMKQKTKSYVITGLAGALVGLMFMWVLLAPPIQIVVP